MTVVLEERNWHASASFKVQNNTEEILYQIWIRLSIEHPHIRIQDFTVETLSPTDESFKEIVLDKDQERKKAKYLVIKRLSPGETRQFIITKNTPYIDSSRRQPKLHAAILSFDKEAPSKKYEVYVDDNFHFTDESERYKLGDFDTCEEAVAACMKIVDEFVEGKYKKGMSFKKLYEGYTGFGEDPFIISDDKKCSFSAWEYAKKRCAELCANS